MEIENKAQTIAPVKTSGKKKFIMIAIALLAIGGAGSYFLPGDFNVWNKLNLSIGGNTAATVNGEKITKTDLDLRFEQLKEANQLQGVDLSDEKAVTEIKKQMLNDMISEKIILQNAMKSGISSSQADVQSAYDQLITNFKTKEDFEKELVSRKITEQEVKDGIAKQMILSKYIEQKVDLKNVSATDAEIKALYDNYSSKQENMPKLEEIKDQLGNEVKQQKSRAMVLDFVENLKKDADIKIFL